MKNNLKVNRKEEVSEEIVSPVHYFLMRGYEAFHDGDEWIGIYNSRNALLDAYNKAEEELKKELEEGWASKSEKIMINIFDECTGKWKYNVKPELLMNEEI